MTSAGIRSGGEWVLSRALTHFAYISTAGVPKAQWHSVVALKVKQASPYQRTDWCAIRGETGASVWLWDKSVVETSASIHPLDYQSLTVFPECVLVQQGDDGLRYQACLDGVEGQVWLKGQLIGSRWWPMPIELPEWNQFLRDAGIAPASTMPVLSKPGAFESPWARLSTGRSESAAGYERPVLVALTSILALTTSWYAVRAIQWQTLIYDKKAQLSAVEDRAKPLQDARQRALAIRDRNDFLRSLNPYPPQLAVQAEIARRLPKDGTYVKEWDYRDGRLALVLASSARTQSSGLVKDFLQSGWFKDVVATSSADAASLPLEMKLLPLTEMDQKALANEKPPEKKVAELK